MMSTLPLSFNTSVDSSTKIWISGEFDELQEQDFQVVRNRRCHGGYLSGLPVEVWRMDEGDPIEFYCLRPIEQRNLQRCGHDESHSANRCGQFRRKRLEVQDRD